MGQKKEVLNVIKWIKVAKENNCQRKHKGKKSCLGEKEAPQKPLSPLHKNQKREKASGGKKKRRDHLRLRKK